jgi:hypothetical protein
LSLTARDERRISPSIWIGLVLALVAAILISLAVLREQGRGAPDRSGATTSEGDSTEPSIRQARWRIRGRVIGRLPERRRKALIRQRERIAAGIKQAYEGLFLDPRDLRSALRGVVVTAAANQLIRRDAGVPARAKRVKTLKREASIWIQAGGFRRAAAKVIVRARATVGERTRRVNHVANLWLVRRRSKWRVIAYDFHQKPIT